MLAEMIVLYTYMAHMYVDTIHRVQDGKNSMYSASTQYIDTIHYSNTMYTVLTVYME